MMANALDNISGNVFKWDEQQISRAVEASRKSKRRRIILPVHRQQDAPVQRMLNFLQPDTYIRPHRHPMEGASESIVVLQGEIRFFVFSCNGNVLQHCLMNTGLVPVLDIEPGVWHSFVVLKPDTILFEAKQGPYNAETDKEFAAWSPPEFSKKARQWVAHMKTAY